MQYERSTIHRNRGGAHRHLIIAVSAFLACTAVLGNSFPHILFAQNINTAVQMAQSSSVDELQKRINDRNAQIEALNKEIANYQKQITETSAQAKTLNNTIKEINATISKLTSEVTRTQAQIGRANDTIEQLNSSIEDKEESIALRRKSLQQLLAQLYRASKQNTLESLLANTSLSAGFIVSDDSVRIQRSVNQNLEEIRTQKADLELTKAGREKEKNALQTFQQDLKDQQGLAQSTKKEKDQLLKRTKSQEQAYQKELKERVALREAFEKELRDYEAALKFAIDPNSIPSSGSKALSWPIANARITQQFGDTEFSRANAMVYNGRGHNGIDLGASIGTPILAAASGRVIGTGDTDLACPRASYGRWILIEHPNGLTTLYAHLSVFRVAKGDEVRVGQTIGLSGNTGYSTGPHLHFTVFASQGVQVQTRPSKACGTTYTMPVADYRAYLNPLLYL